MLTSVSRLATHLGIPMTGDTALRMQRLIASASGYIESVTGRSFLGAVVSHTQRRPARGYPSVILDQRAIKVDAIKFGRAGYRVAQPISNFAFNDEKHYTEIEAINGDWPDGGENVIEVTYRAGYTTTRAGIISRTPVVLDHFHVMPVAVTIAGTLATQATSNPAAGQFAVAVDGSYSFNAADDGKAYEIIACIVPPAIEQACMDMASWANASRDRVGVVSKSLGGQETVSFSQSSMSATTREVLAAYSL